MAQLFGINLPLPDLHGLDPARVLAQLASSGSTMGKSLDDLLQRRLAGSVATPSRSGDTCAIMRRTGLASAGLRAVDMKASVLGFVSLGGLLATTAQAALSPRGEFQTLSRADDQEEQPSVPRAGPPACLGEAHYVFLYGYRVRDGSRKPWRRVRSLGRWISRVRGQPARELATALILQNTKQTAHPKVHLAALGPGLRWHRLPHQPPCYPSNLTRWRPWIVGPGTCDRNMCERCCNVATSTPYIACGCHALKHRKTASGKAWGASVVAAGAASMVFHSSYGSFREWGRRLDFW